MSTHSSSDSAVCLVCVALTFFFSGLSGLSTSPPLHFCFAPAQALQAVPCLPLGHNQANPILQHHPPPRRSPPCSWEISPPLRLPSPPFARSSSPRRILSVASRTFFSSSRLRRSSSSRAF